jgi:hypothetical protein
VQTLNIMLKATSNYNCFGTMVYTLEDVLFPPEKTNKFSNTDKLDLLLSLKGHIKHIAMFSVPLKNKYLKSLAKIELEPDEKYEPLYLELVELTELWSVFGFYDMTPLQQICYRGDEKYYNILNKLTMYPDLWKIKYKDQTALSLLISSCYNFHQSKLNNIIIKLTLYPDLWSMTNNYGATPLHALCKVKNDHIFETLNVLVEYYELWENTDSESVNPLHNLCIHKPNDENARKYISVFKKLVKYINLWSVQETFGYTPLHFFCRNFGRDQFSEIYNELDDNSEIWNIQNNSGITALNMTTGN